MPGGGGPTLLSRGRSCVAPFELLDKSLPGKRAILVYFLVDPYVKVRSTGTVPPQQAEWLARELRRMGRFRELPAEVLSLILSHVPGLERGVPFDAVGLLVCAMPTAESEFRKGWERESRDLYLVDESLSLICVRFGAPKLPVLHGNPVPDR